MYIQDMIEAGQSLLVALETQDASAIPERASIFSKAVDNAWTAYLRSEIPVQVRGQSLPRTLHQFATVELPSMASDPQRWPAITREVRLFLNMVNVVAK